MMGTDCCFGAICDFFLNQTVNRATFLQDEVKARIPLTCVCIQQQHHFQSIAASALQ